MCYGGYENAYGGYVKCTLRSLCRVFVYNSKYIFGQPQ